MTDDLRSRFDDLRARTIPEVQPPGESAVPAHRQAAPRYPVRRSGGRPRRAGRLSDLAVRRLGRRTHTGGAGNPRSHGSRPRSRPKRPARWARTSGARICRALRAASRTYTVGLSCVGPGKVTFTFTVGDPATSELTSTVTCGRDEPVQERTLVVTRDSVVTVEIDPDADAVRRAAYAYSAALSTADRLRLRHTAVASVGTGAQATSTFLDGPQRLVQDALPDGGIVSCSPVRPAGTSCCPYGCSVPARPSRRRPRQPPRARIRGQRIRASSFSRATSRPGVR